MVPAVSVEEVMTRGLDAAGATVNVDAADFVCTGELLSVTVAVKLEVPAEVGAPEIAPAAAESVRPAGKLPDVIDQV